jgi:PqqD family protein of HPr-rel-A system
MISFFPAYPYLLLQFFRFVNDIQHSRWSISGAYSILHRRFGEHYAIYHRGSGDTHLMDSVSFFVLNEINSSAQSFEELLEKLKAEYEFVDTEQPHEILSSIVLEFQKMLIIERLDT